MTPAAQLAQKRLEAVELIRQHAPARLQDALIALLRPAIALSATRADDAEIPLGASKFGGAPDVPAGFEWPLWNDKPLGFLAQINLGEVSAFDVEDLLPKSGLLLFFHGWRDRPFFDSEHWVEFVPNEQLRVAPEPMNFNSKASWSIPLCRVSPVARWTLPDVSNWASFNITVEDWDEVDSLIAAVSQPTEHRLLGYASAIQDSVEISAEMQATGMNYSQRKQFEANALQWLPLLQIDSQLNPGYEPKWMFGDAGMIQWMIRDADIKAQRWDETQFVFQGC